MSEPGSSSASEPSDERDQFTPDGGKVPVFAEVMQSNVEISIADTGEGISPGFLPHLFERFSQAVVGQVYCGCRSGCSLEIIVQMHVGDAAARAAEGAADVDFHSLPLQAPKSSEGEENLPHTRTLLSGLSVDRE